MWHTDGFAEGSTVFCWHLCIHYVLPAPHLSSGQPPTLVWSIRGWGGPRVPAPEEGGTVFQQRLAEQTGGSDVFLPAFAFLFPFFTFTEDELADRDMWSHHVDFTEVTEGKWRWDLLDCLVDLFDPLLFHLIAILSYTSVS